MLVNIRGVCPVHYVSKKTGRRVDGVRLAISFADSRYTGEAVKEIYVTESVWESCCPVDFVPGDVANISFDWRGRINGISLVN